MPTNISIAQHYTLGPAELNLVLLNPVTPGMNGDFTGQGNVAGNQINGNDYNNTLIGLAGQDTLSGGAGGDTLYAADVNRTLIDSLSDALYGGLGRDTLYANGEDFLYDGDDNDVLYGDVGANNVLRGDTGYDLYFVNDQGTVVIESNVHEVDVVKSYYSINVHGANYISPYVENMYLLGSAHTDLVANDLQNFLYGNDGNNRMESMGGSDVMGGGAGDDMLYADTAAYLLLENMTGADSLFGQDGHDALYGNGNDLLEGEEGNDWLQAITGTQSTLRGGNGNDTYYVSPGQVIEEIGTGIDTLISLGSVNLPTNTIENIRLEDNPTYGVGASISANALDNMIVGNRSYNMIHANLGNDTVYGMGGNDTIYGSYGNDVLYLQSPTNTGVDNANGMLSGYVGDDVLVVNGNDRAYGEDGDDVLIVSAGSGNMLYGGNGNDIYRLGEFNATVVDGVNQGIDLVQSSIALDLNATQFQGQLENIELTGASHVNATGNALANQIKGNAANNVLNGGDGNDTLQGGDGNDQLFGEAGNDTLKFGEDESALDQVGSKTMVGGAGADVFWFSNTAHGGAYASTSTNFITVQDFVSGQDSLRLGIHGLSTMPSVLHQDGTGTDFNLLLATACSHGGTLSNPKLATFTYGGDAYLVLDRSAPIAASPAAFNSNADLVIKLVGVTGLTLSNLTLEAVWPVSTTPDPGPIEM